MSVRRVDPVALLQALEDARLDYVVIGALARVLHGSGERTDSLDVVTPVRDRTSRRLERLSGLPELEPRALGEEPIELDTRFGRLRLGVRAVGDEGLRRASLERPPRAPRRRPPP